MDVLKGIYSIREDAKPHGCGSSSSCTSQLVPMLANSNKKLSMTILCRISLCLGDE
ncbi:Uncharacterised protein [Legionella bozemanae]|uniref:Uncharacterized protein n=1 Tax=Legionella bozemanae TaxID=447 RepID=A0A0W0RYY8_LEGBO|nr:hypothetical protein Lboz_0509 [Legionella bozemanae]STO35304.1 Uncharacterised protein [Legionella bozemanae]